MTYVIDKADWYRAVVEEFPSSHAFAELAELLYEDAKYEEVVEVCSKGLKQAPNNIKGKLFLALGLLKLGQQENSERLLYEIKESISYLSRLFVALAEIENLKDNKKIATALIKTAYALNPEDEEVLEKALDWDIKNIETIDTVAKIRYEKHIETEPLYEPPRPDDKIAQVAEPSREEEIPQKLEKENMFARFADFAVNSIDEKLQEMAQLKSEIPLSGVFSDEITALIKSCITYRLKETNS